MIQAHPLVSALRDELNTYGLGAWPKRFAVTREEYEAVEDYLQRVGQENYADYLAAGSPDEWDRPLHLMFVGPHGGVMFKGVELIVQDEILRFKGHRLTWDVLPQRES